MDTLDDPMWYRVAALRPRLRLRVRIQRRLARGCVWYVLVDDEQGRFHRVDAAGYQFIGRLDGSITVDEAWRSVHQRLGEAAPTQGEALRMLAQLSDAELLAAGAMGDLDAVLRRRRERKQSARAAIANPLSFKVPLFDPTRALDRVLPFTRWAFGRAGLGLWGVLMAGAAVLATRHGSELAAALSLHARSPAFLVQMWLVYPLVKLIHEACHAIAVRRWGGEVRQVGISLVMLNPLPYVDASAANGFPRRGRRIAVSAVGVMAELAMAAAALFVWSATTSPTLQAAALAVCASCGLSTLLFNANPLTRFDGYYMLCDALDLPNLQQRGRAMVAHFAQRLIGASDAAASPERSHRDTAIVTAYAVLAWAYQAAVLVSIAWWLQQPYPLLAAGLMLLGAWLLLVRPLGKASGFLLTDSRLNGRRLRALGIGGGATAAVLTGLFVVPMPSFTVQQGVVWAPPEAVVRADVAGELVRRLVEPDAAVQPGQPVALLDNLELRSEREAASARRQQLDLQYFNALLVDPLEARQVALEKDAVEARLARLDDQLDSLTVRAHAAGRLVIPKDSGQPGHFYRQGIDLGYVVSGHRAVLVKVALTDAQAAKVRHDTRAVTVRLDSAASEVLPAALDRDSASVTKTLPSAVLGSAAGGPVPTDPDDAGGRLALVPVAVMDVRVTGHRTDLIGAKAWVRFDHADEPLAHQWGRALQQAFLSRLGGPA